MKSFYKAILLGILGAFFFAFNFILIRSMNLNGGYFLWSAVLRYTFTVPLLLILCIKEKSYVKVFNSISQNPKQWILWSTVGFGLFYAPLSAASIYGESWFTASIWQFTIVAGVLLTPLFGKKIPFKNLLFSFIIVIGIMLMQYSKIIKGVTANWPMLIFCMAIATFSYPLGNRKMMQLVGDSLSTTERVFGMTLCSMPFWILCALVSFINSGLPSRSQCFQSFLIALLAGVIATLLFFYATSIVKDNPKQLAVIEATQSGEVLFTVFLGIFILKDTVPDIIALCGIIIIIIGMIANSIVSIWQD